MAWEGFHDVQCTVGEAEYFVTTGGDGPPVLLLHGFPQTHWCWRHVAPALAVSHRVVAADLRGYGASTAPPGGPNGEGYSKRELAGELIELMDQLGIDRFAVVGHDRGGRVTFRLALDHPRRIERAALLNIVPTVDQFERMGAGPSLGYWPWFLLATPAPLPERMLLGDPDAVLDHAFDHWSEHPDAIDPESRARYRAAITPTTAAAICADYRASFYLDRSHDAADRASARRIEMPLLVVVGRAEEQLRDARDVWLRWTSPSHLETATASGGHFIPEEAPDELAALLRPFLSPP